MWDASMAVEPEWLPALDVPKPARQRRLTVFFRLLLLIPQFIVLWLLSIAAFVVTVLGWFGALFLGRLPEFAASFLTTYLGYDTRAYAYLMLLVDRYPPFELRPPGYPVRVEVRPGPLNRLAVFFRIILVIPAAIIQTLLISGWAVLAFFCWLVVLIAGRMPRPLFEATAATLRYWMRYQAYLLMLTSAYPKRLFGDAPGTPAEAVTPTGPDAGIPLSGLGEGTPATGLRVGVTRLGQAASATRPLVMSGAGKGLLVLFLVVGLGSEIGGSFGGASGSSGSTVNDNGTVSVLPQAPLGPTGPAGPDEPSDHSDPVWGR